MIFTMGMDHFYDGNGSLLLWTWIIIIVEMDIFYGGNGLFLRWEWIIFYMSGMDPLYISTLDHSACSGGPFIKEHPLVQGVTFMKGASAVKGLPL